MNILILAGLTGGVETHVRNLVRMLVERNTNPHVIALSPPLRTVSEEKYTSVPATGHHPLDFSHLVEAAYNYVLTNRVDLIHAHFITPPGHCALILKQFKGIPYVVTLHGDDVHYICKTSIFKKQTEVILSNASKIITVSNFLANEIKETVNIDSERITVISNIVDANTFNPNIDGKPIRDRYRVYDPIILYAGRHWYNKGLHILLLAFKKLLDKHPTLKLMMTSDGPIRNELLHLARYLKIDDKIMFTGHVPYEELPLYMAACDVVVVPSVFEGQSMVALEAMSCGKPVVATAAGGLSEVVIDGVNGLSVKPYDVNGLAQALERLIENEDLRRGLGLRGRTIIEEEYDWNHIADKILNTYTEAIIAEFNALHLSQ